MSYKNYEENWRFGFELNLLIRVIARRPGFCRIQCKQHGEVCYTQGTPPMLHVTSGRNALLRRQLAEAYVQFRREWYRGVL